MKICDISPIDFENLAKEDEGLEISKEIIENLSPKTAEQTIRKNQLLEFFDSLEGVESDVLYFRQEALLKGLYLDLRDEIDEILEARKRWKKENEEKILEREHEKDNAGILAQGDVLRMPQGKPM